MKTNPTTAKFGLWFCGQFNSFGAVFRVELWTHNGDLIQTYSNSLYESLDETEVCLSVLLLQKCVYAVRTCNGVYIKYDPNLFKSYFSMKDIGDWF